MAKISVKVATTNLTVNLFIQDSSSTTGAGLTGLAYNTASLVAYYALPAAASASITLATQTTTGAFSSGGFVEISSANMPGWYRFDVPNAAIASGRFSSIHFKGATNMAPLPLEIELTGWDNSDAVRGGMTALPNANAEAAGGLYTRGTGAGQINQDANGRVDVSLKAILGTTLTETAGQIAAAFKKFFDIAGPTSTMNRITLVDTTTTLTNAPSDSSGTTALLGRLTAARAGYLDNLSAGAVMLASSYTAPDNTSIAAIKTTTDKFAFTIANQVDCNIQYVNDTQVNGSGTSGSPWGP